MESYAVIMAGGSGTRFWPLSRRQHPKQLLPLFSPKTLIEETVDRIRALFPVDRILVVCNAEHVPAVRNCLTDIPADNIIGEPVGRNTAPCVALAAEIIHRRNPEAVMCLLPADHSIREEERFRTLIDIALKAANQGDTLVTFGIIPTTPHTGYGYIRSGATDSAIEGVAVLKAEEFVEKPDRMTAEHYLAEGNFYWNSGMFAWKSRVILEELKEHLPEIVQPIHDYFESGHQVQDSDAFRQMFSRLPAISIDFGVMEKSRRVVLIRGDFGWNDVGSWDALESVLPTVDGNVVLGRSPVLVDVRRCVLHGGKALLACIGVSDLVVVVTDDAVLVADKNRSQEVRLVIDQLKQEGRDEFL